MGPGVSVAALLPLAHLLLLGQVEVSGFAPEDALRSGAAGRIGEDRLVVGHLQLLQFLVDLLQVGDGAARGLPVHVAQLGAQVQDGLQSLALLRGSGQESHEPV